MENRDILGSYHRFGEAGITYQVLELLDEKNAKIHVFDTGEITSYPIANIQQDPKEQ